jgi:monomeric isocitrate dehydrogenase
MSAIILKAARGYYQPDDAKASAALCPSTTLNAVIATL